MNDLDEEWFRDWFNTGYYHLLYDNRDEKEAADFLDRLLEELDLKENSKVLDLGCGKGRHSFHLARRGMIVTGIDLSEASIEEANRENVPGTEFFVHDMRYPFRINYYDVVFNLFSSFGYFKSQRENKNALRSGTDALKENGCFVLDFMNAVKVEKELVTTETIEKEGVQFNITRAATDGYITKTIEISHGDKSRKYTESVRGYHLSDLENMFREQGLKILHTYGDYNLGPFNEETSDRLILIAKKTKE